MTFKKFNYGICLEIKKVDRLKGIEFNWIQDDLERLKQPIIGYVAYFQLVNGFEKILYMSKEQIEKHFLKYSKTYAKNKEFVVSDFDSMALKTVLTQLLRKWGIMSTEMQIAYENDQAIITETEKIYIDNPNTNNVIENNTNFQQLEANINKLDNLVFKNE
ncbi:recombinase RecT [Spiroplasma endosymbiont of Colias croceus]|uniref:recombinase RecT n=1 Tax=Spiroplasma endosymbiont of Colias croceus TaxID=3066310 RepID=UPI0030CD2685